MALQGTDAALPILGTMFRRAKRSVSTTVTATLAEPPVVLPSVLHPAPGVEINEVADGLVVYHGGTSQVHYLNATAAAIFVLADGSRTRQEIVDDGAALFPAAADWPVVAERCLADLYGRGILH